MDHSEGGSSYRYDAARRLTGVIAPDPDGSGVLRRKAQRFGYDAAGRRLTSELGTVASADDSGWAGFQSLQREQITLDSNSRVRFSTMSGVNGNLTRTQYSYDALGRMDCTAIRMNPTAWDALPESACTQSNNGINGPDRITQNGYDPLGRVSAARSGVGTAALAEEAATYYRNGQIATVTDANGNRTTYEYDGLDRLLKTKFPVSATGQRVSSDTDFEQLFYSQTNQVVGRRLRDGTVIGFSYDNLNRLVLKDLPGNEPDVTYQYNLNGQLRGATRAGQSVGMQYDALGRIVSEFSPLGTMSYQYDLAGRRTQMAWPDGLNINYDYQVTGEIIGIRENGGAQGPFQLATYTYDDLGRRTRLTRGNGTATNFTYEPGLRLSSWTHDLTGTASDVTVGLTYNPASQIMSRARSNATYAWAGQVATDRPYLVNGLNQYSQAGEVGFGYDARGNLTTSGSTQYAYSSENMLTSTSAGTQLSYDAMLRLTQVDGTLFQYDGLRLIGEYAAGGGTLRRFVYGPGADEPLVIYEGAGSGLPQYLHADERGSIIAVSDNVGNAITTNRYDEHGIPASTNAGRFQYTGQVWIPELGMYYYKARIYSPTLGRFLQTDPIGYGDGLNLYNYAGSDPVNNIDPSGSSILALPSIVANLANIDFGGGGDIFVTGSRSGGSSFGFGGFFGFGSFGGFGGTSGTFGGGESLGGVGLGESPTPDEETIVVTASIDDIVVTAQYDRSNPNYHYFEFSNIICNVSQFGCFPERVFDGLLRNAAPGQDGVAYTGNIVQVPLAGKIQQVVNTQAKSVTNITLPGHIFNPGYINRSVVVYGGSILVRTIGDGIGSNRGLNVFAAQPAFTYLDFRIKLYSTGGL